MSLARFTPSVLDGETLDRLFVHRHDLLDDALERIRAASSGPERRHRLFVGPRGAGKTHLISLIHHRALQADLPVGLSWPSEDPWEIETYEDLLQQILDNLDADVGERRGEAAIRAAAAEQPIVVLLENLDQILTEIGPDGQRRLRALLENDRPVLIIATSTRLSDNLLSQAEPFYGFFDTVQLEPFTVDQARDMLAGIARVTDDAALGAVMDSPEAPARLTTIGHLAGGQPRIWTLLGSGLTTTGIDDMVDMLIARFDDLTPYYQEQLARLAPSERKAIRRLADADRPLTVRDLAELVGADQKSVGKTVSDLRRRGWVRRYENILTRNLDARLSYYELAEPLARIAFQMKSARGRPIKLVLDFLGTWYDAEDLAPAGVVVEGPAATYRETAARAGNVFRQVAHALAPAVPFEVDDSLSDALLALESAVAEYQAGDPRPLLEQPAALSSLVALRLASCTPFELRIELAHRALSLTSASRWSPRVDDLVQAAPSEQRASALLFAIRVEDAAFDGDVVVVDALMAEMDAALSALDLARREDALERLSRWIPCTVGVRPEIVLRIARLLLAHAHSPGLQSRMGRCEWMALFFMGRLNDLVAVSDHLMAQADSHPSDLMAALVLRATACGCLGDFDEMESQFAAMREVSVGRAGDNVHARKALAEGWEELAREMVANPPRSYLTRSAST